MSEDIHICGICKTRFHRLEEFVEHKKKCSTQTTVSAQRTEPSTSTCWLMELAPPSCASLSKKSGTLPVTIKPVVNVSTGMKGTIYTTENVQQPPVFVSPPSTTGTVILGNAIIQNVSPVLLGRKVVSVQNVQGPHNLSNMGVVQIQPGQVPSVVMPQLTVLPRQPLSMVSPKQQSLQIPKKVTTPKKLFNVTNSAFTTHTTLSTTTTGSITNPITIHTVHQPVLPKVPIQKARTLTKASTLSNSARSAATTSEFKFGSTEIMTITPAKNNNMGRDSQVSQIHAQQPEVRDKEARSDANNSVSETTLETIDTSSNIEQPIDLSGTGTNLEEMNNDIVLNEEAAVQPERLHLMDAMPGADLVGDSEVTPASSTTLQETLDQQEPPVQPVESPIDDIQNVTTAANIQQWNASNLHPKDVMTVPSKRYQCKRCSMAFVYKKDLTRHFRVHTGLKPYSCKYCDKKFSRSDKKTIHERTHTGEKPFKCSSCTYATTDGTNLKKHELIHLNQKPFQCQICDYSCRNSNQLTVHIRTHTGDSPFVCYVCKYTFKIKSDLTRHLRIHTGEKPFKCLYCDYRCTIRSNLKTHVKINHDSGRMQECQDCGYKTSSKKNFVNHISTVHSSSSTANTCFECDFTSKDGQELKRHMRTHEHSQDYSDKYKGQLQSKNDKSDSSKRRTTSKRRTYKHKPQTQTLCQKKFKCDKCDAAFVREDSLGCHLRNHDETEKIMAMAVLDLQNPVVVTQNSNPATPNPTITVDTNVAGASEIPNDAQTIQIDVYMEPMDKGRDLGMSDDTVGSDDVLLGLNNRSSSIMYSNETPVLQSQGSNDAELASNAGSQGPLSMSTKEDSNMASSFSSSVLSQAASNLLAFMQNNQNRAVEDNMNNMARVLASSTVASTGVQSNRSQHVASTRSTLTALQESNSLGMLSQTSTAAVSLDVSQNHYTTSSITSSLETTSLNSYGDMFGNFGSAVNSVNGSSVYPLQVLPSQMPQGSQSNWEQLQEAVLQSVQLQSPTTSTNTRTTTTAQVTFSGLVSNQSSNDNHSKVTVISNIESGSYAVNIADSSAGNLAVRQHSSLDDVDSESQLEFSSENTRIPSHIQVDSSSSQDDDSQST